MDRRWRSLESRSGEVDRYEANGGCNSSRPARWTTILAMFVMAWLICVIPQAAIAARAPRRSQQASASRSKDVAGVTASSENNITAARAHELGYSLTPSDAEPSAVCRPPVKGGFVCESVDVPTRTAKAQALAESLFGLGPEPAFSPRYEGSGEEGGFSPKDLQEAYKLPATGGSGQTVAIVDAYDDPNAESDLAAYRSHYGLPACTKANGCFKKVNQKGEEANYPAAEAGWAVEMSLDLDMVSAICSGCHISLVEAENSGENANHEVNLFVADEEAAKLSTTTEVSNSWSSGEWSTESEADKYFDHPGIPITAAAGDKGYGVGYPAASPDVIAVGGTALSKTSDTRKWVEEAWSGSGGGCSQYESKPSWQSDAKCSHRMDDDVAAVASPSTPVSLYDSYETSGYPYYSTSHWLLVGGTSVATPIIAAVEAHSSSTKRSMGAEAFYKDQGSLFDVAWASNSSCTSRFEEIHWCDEHEYFYRAEAGYDGPTGNGTPDFDPSEAPSVAASPAKVVSATAVTLTGSVNPQGKETHYQFEYGLTTAYGSSVPASPASAGSGTSDALVSQGLTGLKSETTYHYRLVASNSSGTTDGEDRTFSIGYWTEQPSSYPSGGGELMGVACSSSTACVAVGSHNVIIEKEGGFSNPSTSAERWNGTEWSIMLTPNPTKEGAIGEWAQLVATSCSSSTVCTAVGSYLKEATVRALVERWNGTEWSIQ